MYMLIVTCSMHAKFICIEMKILALCVFIYFFFFYRERLIRLQHENKILKINEGATVDKQLTLVQSMLDDARSRINELETDNRY